MNARNLTALALSGGISVLSACEKRQEPKETVTERAPPERAPIVWNRGPTPACDRVLGEVCGPSHCQSFADATAFVTARNSPGCVHAEAGHAGQGRYFEFNSGFDSVDADYDQAGTLIHLAVSNDTMRGCVFGETVSGPRRKERDLCASH